MTPGSASARVGASRETLARPWSFRPDGGATLSHWLWRAGCRTVGICLTLLWLVPAGGAFAQEVVPYNWRNVVVGGGGFAPGIIFSTAEPDLAYLRTDMGGAYRWDRRAGSWVPLMDGLSDGSLLGVESIAADLRDPRRVYVAAGMHYRGISAVLRSDDRGATWKTVEVPFRMGGNEAGRGLGERLAIDPHHPQRLLFGSRHDGLWRSNDFGASWHKEAAFPWLGAGPPVLRQTHAGISFLVFDPRSGRVVAGIADREAAGVLLSEDSGSTWRKVAGGPAGLLPLKASYDGAGTLYISWASDIGPGGVTAGAVWALERSGTWRDVTPDKRADAPQGGYIGIAADPGRTGHVYVSTFNRWKPGDTLSRTIDGGRSWADLGPLSHRDTRATPFLNCGQPEAEFGHWIAGLALDPFRPERVAYTTGATLYLTGQAAGTRVEWNLDQGHRADRDHHTDQSDERRAGGLGVR